MLWSRNLSRKSDCPDMPDSDDPLLFASSSPRLPRKALREFASQLRELLAGERCFTCLLTSDSELRRLNRQFLKKDYATDVLSFPALPGSDTLGDIAISVDRAASQASEYGHSVADEVRILMLHGVLHLVGYDHERDSGRMARAEARWRKKLGLPSGLIERVQA